MDKKVGCHSHRYVPHNDDNYNNIKESIVEISPSLVQTAITVSRQPQVTLDAVRLLHERGVLGAKRAEQIVNCQADRTVIFICADCGNVAQVKLQGCGSRLCMYCNGKHRQRNYMRLQGVFGEFETLRFLTLGFRNVSEISENYFKECQEQFRLFKQSLARARHVQGCLCGRCDYGKKEVKGYTLGGYVNVMEVKFHRKGEIIRSRKDGRVMGEYTYDQWNVHYHILYDGDYIPQGIAQDFFSRATGGESFYTYIKACAYREPVQYQKAALRYVLKYLSKLEGHGGDPQIIARFYEATRKVRFFNIGLKKADRQRLPPKQKITCDVCGGQDWLTPYNAGDVLDKLLEGVTAFGSTHLSPAKPKNLSPSAVAPLVQSMEIVIDDIESPIGTSVGSRKISRGVIAGFLMNNGPQSFDSLKQGLSEQGVSCSDRELEHILSLMQRDGDIYSIKPGEWMVLE